MESDLTYAELFAGAGGLSMGLEMAGWKAVAHAEIDKHARAILRKHWPDCRLDGDVSQLNGADYAGVTLLSGGSPCQDLSIAGKRKGLEGERSGLFHQQVRIWRESGAPYILWENVLGALSSNKGEDFGVVLSTIVGAAVPVPADGWRGAGVASGPAGVAAWRVLDAQYFGVPQRRRRVFVLGVADGSVDPAEVLSLSEGVSGHPAACRQAREGVAADSGAGVDSASNCLTPWDNKGKRVFGADGVWPTLYAAPTSGQQQQTVLTYDTRGNGDGQVVNTMAGDHQNRVTDYTALVIQRGTEQIATAFNWQSGGDVRLEPSDERANTLQANQTQAVILRNREGKPGGGKGPLLSAEREGTLGTSNDQVVFTTGSGNAKCTCSCTPLSALPETDGEETLWQETGGCRGIQAQEVLQQGVHGTGVRHEARESKSIMDDSSLSREEDMPAGAVCCVRCGEENGRTSHQRGLARQQAGEPPAPMSILPHQDTQVGIPRRLTPIETERLMGWPDDHTALGVDEQGREYALADTARYKACGNGVASPVAAWIAFRLRDALDTPRERA